MSESMPHDGYKEERLARREAISQDLENLDLLIDEIRTGLENVKTGIAEGHELIQGYREDGDNESKISQIEVLLEASEGGIARSRAALDRLIDQKAKLILMMTEMEE